MPHTRAAAPFSAHRFLRDWRKAAGLTLDQVAQHEGVGHSTVQRWESGEVPVTLVRLESLAGIYGASHPFELMFSPEQKVAAGRLWEHYQLLLRMSGAEADAWLHFGEKIATPPSPQNARPTTTTPADNQGVRLVA